MLIGNSASHFDDGNSKSSTDSIGSSWGNNLRDSLTSNIKNECSNCSLLEQKLQKCRKWRHFMSKDLVNAHRFLHLVTSFEQEREKHLELQLAYDQRSREWTQQNDDMIALLHEMKPLRNNLRSAEIQLEKEICSREKFENESKALNVIIQQQVEELASIKRYNPSYVETLEKKLAKMKGQCKILKTQKEYLIADQVEMKNQLASYQHQNETLHKKLYWVLNIAKLCSSLLETMPHGFDHDDEKKLAQYYEEEESYLQRLYSKYEAEEKQRLKIKNSITSFNSWVNNHVLSTECQDSDEEDDKVSLVDLETEGAMLQDLLIGSPKTKSTNELPSTTNIRDRDIDGVKKQISESDEDKQQNNFSDGASPEKKPLVPLEKVKACRQQSKNTLSCNGSRTNASTKKCSSPAQSLQCKSKKTSAPNTKSTNQLSSTTINDCNCAVETGIGELKEDDEIDNFSDGKKNSYDGAIPEKKPRVSLDKKQNCSQQSKNKYPYNGSRTSEHKKKYSSSAQSPECKSKKTSAPTKRRSLRITKKLDRDKDTEVPSKQTEIDSKPQDILCDSAWNTTRDSFSDENVENTPNNACNQFENKMKGTTRQKAKGPTTEKSVSLGEMRKIKRKVSDDAPRMAQKKTCHRSVKIETDDKNFIAPVNEKAAELTPITENDDAPESLAELTAYFLGETSSTNTPANSKIVKEDLFSKPMNSSESVSRSESHCSPAKSSQSSEIVTEKTIFNIGNSGGSYKSASNKLGPKSSPKIEDSSSVDEKLLSSLEPEESLKLLFSSPTSPEKILPPMTFPSKTKKRNLSKQSLAEIKISKRKSISSSNQSSPVRPRKRHSVNFSSSWEEESTKNESMEAQYEREKEQIKIIYETMTRLGKPLLPLEESPKRRSIKLENEREITQPIDDMDREQKYLANGNHLLTNGSGKSLFDFDENSSETKEGLTEICVPKMNDNMHFSNVEMAAETSQNFVKKETFEESDGTNMIYDDRPDYKPLVMDSDEEEGNLVIDYFTIEPSQDSEEESCMEEMNSASAVILNEKLLLPNVSNNESVRNLHQESALMVSEESNVKTKATSTIQACRNSVGLEDDTLLSELTDAIDYMLSAATFPERKESVRNIIEVLVSDNRDKIVPLKTIMKVIVQTVLGSNAFERKDNTNALPRTVYKILQLIRIIEINLKERPFSLFELVQQMCHKLILTDFTLRANCLASLANLYFASSYIGYQRTKRNPEVYLLAGRQFLTEMLLYHKGKVHLSLIGILNCSRMTFIRNIHSRETTPLEKVMVWIFTHGQWDGPKSIQEEVIELLTKQKLNVNPLDHRGILSMLVNALIDEDASKNFSSNTFSALRLFLIWVSFEELLSAVPVAIKNAFKNRTKDCTDEETRNFIEKFSGTVKIKFDAHLRGMDWSSEKKAQLMKKLSNCLQNL